MRKETQSLIQLLPYAMREKARGYLDYVNDVLYQVALQEDVYARRIEVQYEVELIFLLKLIYAVFVTGYQNFDNVLRYLEREGARGFSIGSSDFGRQSELTQQWQEVVTGINAIVSDLDSVNLDATQRNTGKVSRYIKTYGSVEDIVREIVKDNLK
ncbi:MAG: hypothetical protein IPO91_32000 [Chloroflexi bacterium]|nr:hypothetical protein [Chloroflexota bacterium]